MVAILTKFLGATNSRGSRVKAWRGDDSRVSVTVDYDHAVSTEQAHYNAAVTLCNRFDWLRDGMVLIGGGTKTGYAYVFASDRILADAKSEVR